MKDSYAKLAQDSKEALINYDLQRLKDLEMEVDKERKKGEILDADPDLISIGEYLDYARLLIEKGFKERDKETGEEYIVPYSREVAEDLVNHWFPE